MFTRNGGRPLQRRAARNSRGLANRDASTGTLTETSRSVIVCGYLNGKERAGGGVHDRPFHGLFLGLDNASGFVVTGTGGAEKDTAETLDVCKRSGLDLSTS